MEKDNLMNLVVRVDPDLMHRFRIVCVKKKWTQAQVIREYIESITRLHEGTENDHAKPAI